MADIDKLAAQVSDRLTDTLYRVRSLIGVVAIIAFVVAAATFATGMWAFGGNRTAWIVIGGVLCLIPIGAALMGLALVHTTAKAAPRLLGDVRTLIRDSRSTAGVLIDHDTGQRLTNAAKSFQTLRTDLKARRTELPALFAGVRAITSVPGLAAITVIGILIVGSLGTILLLSQLFG